MWFCYLCTNSGGGGLVLTVPHRDAGTVFGVTTRPIGGQSNFTHHIVVHSYSLAVRYLFLLFTLDGLRVSVAGFVNRRWLALNRLRLVLNRWYLMSSAWSERTGGWYFFLA